MSQRQRCSDSGYSSTHLPWQGSVDSSQWTPSLIDQDKNSHRGLKAVWLSSLLVLGASLYGLLRRPRYLRVQRRLVAGGYLSPQDYPSHGWLARSMSGREKHDDDEHYDMWLER